MSESASRRMLAACLVSVLLLAACVGCGTGLGSGASGTHGWPQSSGNATGNVMGGQQPIGGATLQLYAVNLTTQRGLATSLLFGPEKTDADGNFNLTGKYVCPAGAYVYLTATGGDPGAGVNGKVALMTGLGRCADQTPATFIQVNEVTTVATAYALQGFMQDMTHAGAAASQAKGLQNAFAMINALVNTATGHAGGPALPQGAEAPVAKLNAAANVLAACVNSDGTGAACGTLFAATTSAQRGVPADTISAALAMAAQPVSNAGALFSLQTPTPPFQPALNSAPHDWTLAVKLGGNGLKTPRNVAIEAGGGAWVTNEAGNSVTHFGPLGDPSVAPANYTANYFGMNTLRAPHGLSVDLAGNIWVASTGNDNIVKFSSTGALLSNFGYNSGGMNAPIDVVVDSSSNVWVANFGNGGVTKLTLGGLNSTMVDPIRTSGTLSGPTAIAVGPNGLMHLASGGNGTVVSFDASAAVQGGVGHTDNGMQGTAGIAVDGNGTIWVPQPGLNAISALKADYTPLSGSPVKSSGLAMPMGVAIDGASTVWVTNGGDAGSLTAIDGTTGKSVLQASMVGELQAPYGVAVDGSGNVWTANTGSDTVSVFVGLAAPSVVPIVARF